MRLPLRDGLVWSALLVGIVAVNSVGLGAQGIPLLKSVNVIVDTILQIVRPVAVIALMVAGLMYMFGEGSVRWIANILFGGAIAVFAVSIVAAIF